mmetsp:Transcript_2344/g.5153  ORF Transcript_2344/g.5153 Transcript_2344/m.5153 type:complete len:221 (-) Transcript_2344:58-720(-)
MRRRRGTRDMRERRGESLRPGSAEVQLECNGEVPREVHRQGPGGVPQRAERLRPAPGAHDGPLRELRRAEGAVGKYTRPGHTARGDDEAASLDVVRRRHPQHGRGEEDTRQDMPAVPQLPARGRDLRGLRPQPGPSEEWPSRPNLEQPPPRTGRAEGRRLGWPPGWWRRLRLRTRGIPTTPVGAATEGITRARPQISTTAATVAAGGGGTGQATAITTRG